MQNVLVGQPAAMLQAAEADLEGVTLHDDNENRVSSTVASGTWLESKQVKAEMLE